MVIYLECPLLRAHQMHYILPKTDAGHNINVMQKSVVYWKWPNVVDIYCKRADAIKRTY